MHQLFADVSSRHCKNHRSAMISVMAKKKIIRMDRDLPSLRCRRKLISVVAVTFSEGDGISAAGIRAVCMCGYVCVCVCLFLSRLTYGRVSF